MQPAIVFTDATEDDARDVWGWRNDPQARAASFDGEPIPWQEHRRWFEAKLADPDCAIWIARIGDEAVGQLRLDRTTPDTVEVSITVAPDRRGRGIGTAMLRSMPLVVGGEPWVRCRAWVKADNAGSMSAFRSAGFQQVVSEERAGVVAVLFELTR